MSKLSGHNNKPKWFHCDPVLLQQYRFNNEANYHTKLNNKLACQLPSSVYTQLVVLPLLRSFVVLPHFPHFSIARVESQGATANTFRRFSRPTDYTSTLPRHFLCVECFVIQFYRLSKQKSRLLCSHLILIAYTQICIIIPPTTADV